MKYISEFTHEILGHGGFGFLLGGTLVNYYISWIWPLEFGYAFVNLPLGSSSTLRAIVASGGIISCAIGALISHIIIYSFNKKREIRNSYLFILFHFIFWYGVWGFMNSAGYLLVGALLNFGDIGQIVLLTGINNIFFISIGFIELFILYFFISINTYTLFGPLLHLKQKWIIFGIWLLIPIVYLLFIFNPMITISFHLSIFLLPVMFIPSIFTLFIPRFKRTVN
jgi:hypothetical protein